MSYHMADHNELVKCKKVVSAHGNHGHLLPSCTEQTDRTSIDSGLCNEWRTVITNIFGKSMGKKFQTLMTDIVAVDLGIKPGYLYDIGKPDANKTLSFLKTLKSLKLITNNLNVVQLGLDVMVVNPETIRNLDISVTSLKDRLVDVSYKRSSPCLYDGCLAREEIINMFQIITENLNIFEIQLYTIDEPECNVSTLFGVLLGYPVMYWYDNKDCCYDNCLSMETLTVTKLYVQFLHSTSQTGISSNNTKNDKHCFYSFSYPTSLAQHFEQLIHKWYDTVQYSMNKYNVFSEPEIVYSTVVQECVNL